MTEESPTPEGGPEPRPLPSEHGGATASSAAPTPDPHAPLEPRTRRELRLQKKARRRHPHLRRILLGLVTLLVVALVGGLLALRHLDGNITRLDITRAMPGRTSTASADPVTNLAPMNILLMGTDGRAELGTDKYGSGKDIVGARSDVTMIAHLAADRKSAVVVSIPRDTMVKGPVAADRRTVCNEQLPTSQWTTNQFNEYFTFGGVTCTIRTVEAMTGLYIDHVAAVDFNGFKDMVNALGTVEVCLTAPVKDKDSGANFPAGRQRLDGEQALSFVRLRHTGDGSDTSRIGRQQDFLGSVVREATSSQLLLNPPKLYGFLNAATGSLSSDADIPAIASIASSMRNMTPSDVRFVSMPWQPYPANTARVMPSPAADKLWKILREDAPWPGSPQAKAAASAAASAPTSSTSAVVSTSAASPSAAATLAGLLPTQVPVGVVNATGKEGFGIQAANALKAQGFPVVGITNGTVTDGVVIHHVPADKAKATELATAFPGAVLKADGAPGQAVTVEIGRGAPKVVKVPNAPAGATLPSQVLVAPPLATPTTIEAKVADQNICSDTGQ